MLLVLSWAFDLVLHELEALIDSREAIHHGFGARVNKNESNDISMWRSYLEICLTNHVLIL